MKGIDREKLVIKLGGSLISIDDGKINASYVEQFSKFINGLAREIPAIFIVVGGGKIVRHYQDTARKLGITQGDDLDLMGMRLTRVNAELIRSSIGRDLAGEIIYTGGEFRWFARVVVGAGWGHAVTSDYNAVVACDMVGTNEFIRLSNVDHIYTDNPSKNLEAKAISDITWDELARINVEEGNASFRPGMNVPLDPRAVTLAKRMSLKMAFIEGSKLEEIRKYLLGKKFEGTLVHP